MRLCLSLFIISCIFSFHFSCLRVGCILWYLHQSQQDESSWISQHMSLSLRLPLFRVSCSEESLIRVPFCHHSKRMNLAGNPPCHFILSLVLQIPIVSPSSRSQAELPRKGVQDHQPGLQETSSVGAMPYHLDCSCSSSDSKHDIY